MRACEPHRAGRAGHFAEFLVSHKFVGTGLGEPVERSPENQRDLLTPRAPMWRQSVYVPTNKGATP